MLGSFVANPILTSPSRTKKSASGSASSENTGPKANMSSGTQTIVAQTALSLEYASIRHSNHCPLGVYVVPSPGNMFFWDAVLFVHQGYYAGAILRFQLIFSNDYPEKIPTIRFMTDIFHPLIDRKGYFNLNARFRPWKPKEHHVYNILYDVKAAFKKYRLDQIKEGDVWNKEAYRYHESISSFSALAGQSSQLTRSESVLYDNDQPSFTGHVTQGLTFQKLSPETLRDYRGKFNLQDWGNDSVEL